MHLSIRRFFCRLVIAGLFTGPTVAQPVDPLAPPANRVGVREEVGGRALLRGLGVIRVKGAAELPHRFVAARDEGEAEALADAPKELPGLPFGAYAVKVMPAQERVALVNATVWTCGPAGVIENGTVLVSGGKIEGVLSGKVEVPSGYRVVDCAGKHITPGIVDCHSHTGISNGVNEAGQAVTAERVCTRRGVGVL